MCVGGRAGGQAGGRAWGRRGVPSFLSSCVEELSLRLARGKGLRSLLTIVTAVASSSSSLARSLVLALPPRVPLLLVKQTLVLLSTVCTCCPCVLVRIKLCVFGCVLLFHYLFVCFLSVFFLCQFYYYFACFFSSSCVAPLCLGFFFSADFSFLSESFPSLLPRFSAFLLCFCDSMRFFCFCFCLVLFLRSSLMKQLLLLMMFLFPSRCLVSSSAAVGVLSAAPGMVG